MVTDEYWRCVRRLCAGKQPGSATVHGSWALAIRVSDTPAAVTLRGNTLPGYDAVLDLGSTTGELTVADNTLRHLEFSSGFCNTDPIQVSLTLRNNTLETLKIRRQAAPLLVEGNTIGAAVPAPMWITSRGLCVATPSHRRASHQGSREEAPGRCWSRAMLSPASASGARERPVCGQLASGK